MQPEIEKAIELIDQKIIGLQKAKETLIEAFGEMVVDSRIQPSLFQRQKRPVPTPIKAGPTRKETIMKLLQEEGPLSRSEIMKRSGIPQGTVANVLTDKDTFGSEEGKWFVVKKEEMQSESSLDLH